MQSVQLKLQIPHREPMKIKDSCHNYDFIGGTFN